MYTTVSEGVIISIIIITVLIIIFLGFCILLWRLVGYRDFLRHLCRASYCVSKHRKRPRLVVSGVHIFYYTQCHTTSYITDLSSKPLDGALKSKTLVQPPCFQKYEEAQNPINMQVCVEVAGAHGRIHTK